MAEKKKPISAEPIEDILNDELEHIEVSVTIDDCDKLIAMLRDMKYELLYKLMEAEEKIEEYRIVTEVGKWAPDVLFHRQVCYKLKLIKMEEREKKAKITMRIYEKWIAQFIRDRDTALTRKLELIRRKERLAWNSVFSPEDL